MKIFLIGPPGSGKNVIAAHIASKLKIKHINYRSLVVDAVKTNFKYSEQLKEMRDHFLPYPPKMAYELIDDYLLKEKVDDFVLEGFPKSAKEAKLLAGHTKKDSSNFTFLIDTSKEVTESRLNNRLVCPECAYVLYDSNPDSILEVECMNCHLPLVRRKDDTNDGIRERIDRYLVEKDGMIEALSISSTIVPVKGGQELSLVISDIVENLIDCDAHARAERGARLLVESLGLNLADPNIIGTPTRMVNTFQELMKGQNREAHSKIRKDLATAFPTRYKGMIIMEPVKCVSLCSHHLLPINYEVLFGYIPKEKSLGFSKVIKVINTLAAKPTLQEDFTQEVIDIFHRVLEPEGLMVVVRGVHSCMALRGEKTENVNITSALKGVFKDHQSAREEFLALARFKS